jgi:hypothetical protein
MATAWFFRAARHAAGGNHPPCLGNSRKKEYQRNTDTRNSGRSAIHTVSVCNSVEGDCQPNLRGEHPCLLEYPSREPGRQGRNKRQNGQSCKLDF